MMTKVFKVRFVRRLELECVKFLGGYDDPGDYLYEAVSRARETLFAALTRGEAELGEAIERAERVKKEAGKGPTYRSWNRRGPLKGSAGKDELGRDRGDEEESEK